MTTAISIQNVSKAYRLGVIGHGTLREDLQSWWARVRGKEDPNRIIGSKEAIEGDTLWALRDVSFDVEQGSVWGIIGADGSGEEHLAEDFVARDRLDEQPNQRSLTHGRPHWSWDREEKGRKTVPSSLVAT